MAKIGLNVAVGANISEFSTKMQNVQRTLKKNREVITRYASAIGTIMTTVGVAAIKASADMEVMKNRLLVAFNGSAAAADKALSEINKFTATTPFQLEEVADGFLKLKNMGLDPSIDSLRSYGNTASAMGKSLDQMIEAVADAAVGEFERLKSFGIKARSQGDQVSFTFQGVTTTVKKSSEEIQKYLLNIGNTNFAGSIEKQSQTLYGQLSTLNDNIKLLAASLGEVLLPAVKKVTSAFTQFVNEVSGAIAFGKMMRSHHTKLNELLEERERLEKRVFAQAKGSERWEMYNKELQAVNKLIDAEQTRQINQAKQSGRGAGIMGGLAGIRAVKNTTESIPLTSGAGISKRGGIIGEMQSIAISASAFGDRLAAGLSEVPEKLNAVKGGFINLGRTINDEILMRIQTMNDMVRTFVIDTIANIADAIGNALAGGGFKDFGKEMLNNLATFLSQFGKMLLLYGIGIEAWIKDLNPATKIAAGVALIAISGAIKGHLSKSSSAMTGGASSSGVASGGGTLTAVIRGGDLYLMTEEYSKRRK